MRTSLDADSETGIAGCLVMLIILAGLVFVFFALPLASYAWHWWSR